MRLLNEIEEVFIETNGIKLHTMIIGSGEPLILLHGFPEFWYCWSKEKIPRGRYKFGEIDNILVKDFARSFKSYFE